MSPRRVGSQAGRQRKLPERAFQIVYVPQRNAEIDVRVRRFRVKANEFLQRLDGLRIASCLSLQHAKSCQGIRLVWASRSDPGLRAPACTEDRPRWPHEKAPQLRRSSLDAQTRRRDY